MSYEFMFPDVGEGITEGELVQWLVKEGDAVRQDQPLAKIETDKAVVELPSPRAGVILKLHHREGDTIKVGEALVTIGEAGEKADAEKAGAARTKEGGKSAQLPPALPGAKKKDAGAVVGTLDEAEEVIAAPLPAATPEDAHVLATPAVRRLARDLHVDLTKLSGSGKDGRITEEGVRRSAQREETPAAKISKKYDMFGYVERVALRGIRKATAKHMVAAAFTAPHVTHMDEADVTELWQLREKEKAAAAKKKIHLTFMPFMIKACVAALREHPYLNATLDEEHEEIVLKKYYNIGVAVDTDGGLLVPVVKNAQDKSVLEIAKELEALAEKARSRSINAMDMKGGSFTITNIGSIGGTHATPIINYPEVAILATGKIRDAPAVRDGKVAVRKILPLSLAFDHRVLDGAEAARFTSDLVRHLEDPEAMLIEE